MALIRQCDRCRKPVIDNLTEYYIQLEEWNHNGYYQEEPDGKKRAQLCGECYKEMLREVL